MKLLTPFALGSALLTAGGAQAVTLDYANFSSTSGLQLNGSAASVNDGGRDVLRLTPAQGSQAGSTFGISAITLGADYSFSTAFTFNINGYGGLGGGADGFVFVVQTVSNTAGTGGGGIGYQDLPNSVGIEFDTYDNGFGDGNSGNHVGIDLNGDIASVALNTALPFTLKSATDLTAFVDYDGASSLLEVRLSDTGLRPAGPLLSYAVDLAATLGSRNAYVGFTSGTGAGYANHDIVSWQFRDAFNPIADPTSNVPEPASWAMMVGGLGLVGGALRGRRRATLAAT